MVSAVKLVQLALGIYTSYLIYGLAQERLYKTPRGEEGERFSHTLSLLFLQCLCNALAALGVIQIAGLPRNETPLWRFAVISSTYILAMGASIASLNHVSMITQVLAKCCKPIPVMIVGLVFGKQYIAERYACVLLLCVGVSMFVLASKTGGKSKETTWHGLGLLMVSLAADGFTGNFQSHTISVHGTTSFQLMLFTNAFALVYLALALAVTGDAWEAIAFCSKHPWTILDAAFFAVSSAVGQVFIFQTLTAAGPLVLSIVTTTRKQLTVLLSILYFGHALVSRQIIGIVLVFAGIAIDVASSRFGFRIFGARAPVPTVPQDTIEEVDSTGRVKQE